MYVSWSFTASPAKEAMAASYSLSKRHATDLMACTASLGILSIAAIWYSVAARFVVVAGCPSGTNRSLFSRKFLPSLALFITVAQKTAPMFACF